MVQGWECFELGESILVPCDDEIAHGVCAL